MGYGMMNLCSVALGLIGWTIPVVQLALCVCQKRGLGRLASVLSLGACGVAIWFQICYDEHLVNIGDWSALMDTIKAVRVVSLFLLITTVLLNLALVWAEGHRKEGF
ncbi:hypothetical protein D1646_00745 [Pseudoflavonifractor sp. 60]|uniref:hypothetical protein n=1 Tax=Pseudoflavonifractor sp. 60 TaxID=2304576 RepID=UPI00136BBE8E|nr:hypothetical protein [Pseudoflavonifractor sp. 60]NBI65357.1 hypothetical protein [Pseudoflavonifractor sp. 60]